MIPGVFDCGVLISAIGWCGNPRDALELVALGQARAILSAETWSECRQRVPEVLAERRPEIDPSPILGWFAAAAHFVEPAPLGKQRSRDVKDDRYLAAALAAGAVLVTNDRDLLDLGKPFGVAILTPIELIKRVRAETMP